MNKSLIHQTLLIAAAVAACSITPALADHVSVNVTASTLISNVPSFFALNQFALTRPFDVSTPPSFPISASPTSQTLSVNPNSNMPALLLTDTDSSSPNYGLTWYYYCQGLTLNYGPANNNATVVFSGQISVGTPGTDVTCSCSGSSCSTTASVPAKLVMQ